MDDCQPITTLGASPMGGRLFVTGAAFAEKRKEGAMGANERGPT